MFFGLLDFRKKINTQLLYSRFLTIEDGQFAESIYMVVMF